MPNPYVYSVSADMPGGAVNEAKLHDEIVASAIATTLNSVRADMDVLTITFTGDLSAGDKTILDGDTTGPAGGLLAAHDNAASATETDLGFQFFADQLLDPDSADWAVNALAPSIADSNNAGLTVRLFDDTIEEGVGFELAIPTRTTSVTFFFKSRAEVGPPAARTVGLKIYERGMPDNAAVEAWSAGTVLSDINIPTTDEFFQYDSQTLALADLGLTAGKVHQFELTRVNPVGGVKLVGDWALLLLEVEFI